KLPRRRNAEPPERFPRGSPIFFVLIERGVLLSVLGGGGGAGCRDLTMREQIASGAALRDFNPAFGRFGSFTTGAVEATLGRMSASPRKRTLLQSMYLRRLVPIAS